MRRLACLVPPALLLGACNVSADGDGGGGATDNVALSVPGAGGGVQMKAGADGVAIDLPGFSAKVDTSGLKLDGADMDVDGMKLAAGTAVTGVNIVGRDQARGGDTIRIGFTNPSAPDAVLAHYRAAGPGAGFTMADVPGGGVSGRKAGGKRFAVTARPQGGGSAGELVVTDPG